MYHDDNFISRPPFLYEFLMIIFVILVFASVYTSDIDLELFDMILVSFLTVLALTFG